MLLDNNSKGFALVAALLGNLILLAVGILAINLSTGDLRGSMHAVGDKKSLNAAEAGYHWLATNFVYDSPSGVAVTNRQVDVGTDPNSRFTIALPTVPATGPPSLVLPGYSFGYEMLPFQTTITGTNTAYNTSVVIDVGFLHGAFTTTYD
jgi:hypothetical protein